MPEENPLKGVLFGKIRLNAFPLTQEDALAKMKEFEERLHPRGQGGKFAPKGGGGKGAPPREASREFGVSREWQERAAYHGREMRAIHDRLKKKDTPDLRVQFRMHDAARRAAMEGKPVTESMIRATLQGKEEERVYNEKFAPKREAQKPKPEEKPREEPKPEKPTGISIQEAQSAARSIAGRLSRLGAGGVSVEDVTEEADGIDIYFYAEDLKIGGAEDVDENDSGLERRLLAEGGKLLSERLPGAKIHPVGGEKGSFGFSIEKPKEAKPKVPIGSVRVETGKYRFSAGREPKGSGMWAFQIGGKTEMIRGSYAEAKGKAVRLASERGEREVQVLP